MIDIFDSSTLINLFNAGALDLVLESESLDLFLGSLVIHECDYELSSTLDEFISKGNLTIYPETEISGSVYLDVLRRYRLGIGETECLAICLHRSDSVMVCDDRRARIVAVDLFGSSRLTGSIGMLREVVKNKVITSREAYDYYSKMIQTGGFLPNFTDDYFNI